MLRYCTRWSEPAGLTAWLRYVLGHIQDWPVNQLRDLLPWQSDLTSTQVSIRSGYVTDESVKKVVCLAI